jgi:hypothetical protein
MQAKGKLCQGRCQGRGAQAFTPTALVPGLVQCRFCSLVRPAAPRGLVVQASRGGTALAQMQVLPVEPAARRTGLVTIGYERRSLVQVLTALGQAEVQVVVDVRWAAFSQVTAFCEEPLRRAVLAAGMNYLHLPVLGSPPALRQPLERTGNYPQFFLAYRQYLADSAAAQQTLHQLADLARERRICLLCRERDHQRCHRSVVAEHLAALVGQPVEHL